MPTRLASCSCGQLSAQVTGLICLILTAGSLFACAARASTDQVNPEQPLQVKVEKDRDHAEVPYRPILEMQHHLRAFLPPEPRLVEMWFRVAYPGASVTERDESRARPVFIKSEHVNVAIPMWKGSYFALPEIQEAYDESADIVIGGADRVWLGLWWSLRVPGNHRMSYADIRQAREQIRVVQNRISAFSYRFLLNVKRQPHDGIKACFTDDSGAILLDGKPVADAVEGQCKVLFNDPARMASDQTVEFSGPLESVIFIDTRYYR